MHHDHRRPETIDDLVGNKKVQNRHQMAGSVVDLNSCLVMTNRVERVIIFRAVGLDRTTAFKYSVHLDELHG